MSKKISFLLIICIMCGVLQACSNQPEIIPPNGVSYRAGSGAIYNNIFLSVIVKLVLQIIASSIIHFPRGMHHYYLI